MNRGRWSLHRNRTDAESRSDPSTARRPPDPRNQSETRFVPRTPRLALDSRKRETALPGCLSSISRLNSWLGLRDIRTALRILYFSRMMSVARCDDIVCDAGYRKVKDMDTLRSCLRPTSDVADSDISSWKDSCHVLASVSASLRDGSARSLHVETIPLILPRSIDIGH